MELHMHMFCNVIFTVQSVHWMNMCTKWHCVYKWLKVVASLQRWWNHDLWLALPVFSQCVCYWYLTKINSPCALQEQQCDNTVNRTLQSHFSCQKGYKMHMEMM